MAAKPKKNELIVYGYIHDIEKQQILSQIIPSTIGSVIMLFFPWIEEFKWNKETHGSNATIVNDKTIKSDKNTSVCVSENILSADVCNWYEWEFKISEIKESFVEFGFVATPINETIKNWNNVFGESEQDEHYTVNIGYGFTHIRVYGKNATGAVIKKHDNQNEEFKFTPKNGDRFRVRIDFKDRDVKLYYNDQFVNSVYKDEISDSVVAAASIYDATITVLKTEYQ